jgi:3',5'-cyclic AMP phosphodiesterase CpdA
MQPYRIAHISDLHISAEHRRANIRNTKTLLRHIAGQGCNHLVITGDLTADAQKKDYAIRPPSSGCIRPVEYGDAVTRCREP